MYVPKNKASALVICLFFVVLLTALLVTFLVVVRMERQISAGSASQIQVDRLAQFGVNTLISDLQREIHAGSVQTNAIYLPRTSQSAVVATNLSTNYLNALRVTRGGAAAWQNFGTNATYFEDGPIRALANNSTTNSAKNRAGVSSDRWNFPRLMGTNLPVGFSTNTPDWIFITRLGVSSNAPASFNLAQAKDPNNENFVIGRYAAVLYDVGGLININIAGNRRPLADNALRGRVHQVPLDAIPGISTSAAEAFVDWRNASTANDTNFLHAPTNTFLKTGGGPGSQVFIRRQDLLNYSKSFPATLPESALPHLTTFSFGLNRPSFRPPEYTGGTVPVTYPNATNAVLLTTQRSDGTPAARTRFPLSRIALLKNGTAAEAASHFGLTKDASGLWTYDETSIKTLGQVAAENREPNFFELLKAVILQGSLGLATDYGNVGDFFDPVTNQTARDQNKDLHVLQIGANIIDQYDSDSYPTRLALGSEQVAGIENIPYMFNLWLRPFRGNDLNGDPEITIGGWTQFQFWNPHQNAATINTDGPTEFRVVAESGRPVFVFATGNPTWMHPRVVTDDGSGGVMDYGPTFGNSTPYQIQFTTSATQTFAEPTPLTPTNSTSPDARASVPAATIMGIFVGQAVAPLNVGPGASLPGAGDYHWADYAAVNEMELPTYLVQFKDSAGDWQTYQKFTNVRWSFILTDSNRFRTASFTHDNPPFLKTLGRHDPRGDRFGLSEVFSPMIGRTYRTDLGQGFVFHAGRPWDFQNLNFFPYTPTSPGGAYEAYYSENINTAGHPYYRDYDGIIRRGDARPGTATTGSYPLQASQFEARPRVLDSPFRSVGDLGYAFRDLPWKTLDLASGTPDASQSSISPGLVSADRGLLEIFSLDETPADEPLIAGKLYLNGRNPTVFQAALRGSALRHGSTDEISAAMANVMADSIVTTTLTNTLENRADLVADLANSLGAGLAKKTRQEAPIRTLSEMGQADVWNLLLDVIIQSGRLSPGALSATDFVVQAEQRIWTQVAIDRHTGKILKIQTEVVDEY